MRQKTCLMRQIIRRYALSLRQIKEQGMHIFDYQELPKSLLTPSVVRLLSSLHEARGGQDLLLGSQSRTLKALVDVARIQSTGASNRIEGIFTSDERLRELVMRQSEPRNRSEQEIAGYRQVLATVQESYEYIPLRPGNILQLHRDLYSYSATEGGRYKLADNVIAETAPDGSQRVRFIPVAAFQVNDAMEDLCREFNLAIDKGEHDPLLLASMFILDFLCIHPFTDGNGRLSRLLILLLLFRCGYHVGKYISIETLIEQTKESYYEALQKSSEGWHEGSSDYAPFVEYSLGVVVRAYRELADRLGQRAEGSRGKVDRVRAVFSQRLGIIRKKDIASLCPDISQTTIERALGRLLEAGLISKVGKGRATGYVWNGQR
ncbi:MAG: Fic family protein [Prevotellaceae bacterium]|nr:Fic family protein [Prevotellaceae bacterium]